MATKAFMIDEVSGVLNNIEYFAMDCFYLFVGCYLPAWLCEQSSAIVQRFRNHAVHGMVYAIAHFSATT